MGKKNDYSLGGLWNEEYVYQTLANLDVKILFGNITHLIDAKIRKMLENVGKWCVWEPRFYIPFWSMIYLLLKLKSIFESDDGIESESQS